jgi:hypothetical protein
MQIVDFLKTLDLKDGDVLMDGWLPQLYWLSGLEAPSKYICTIREWATIPTEEYEALVNKVKERNFKYVILTTVPTPFTGLDSLDPIAQSTITNYFYVKSIGMALIYSKYSPRGEEMSYGFIGEFPQALKEYDLKDGTRGDLETAGDPVIVPSVRSLTVDNETKLAIHQHPVQPNDSKIMNSYVIYSNILISQNSTLRLSIAIDPSVWNEAGDGVQFKIFVEDEGKTNVIFSKYIDPKHVVDDRRWFDYQLGLREYSNKTVNISFVTNPGPNGDFQFDWACWGDPVILTKTG